MKCPRCNSQQVKVLESVQKEDVVHMRNECLVCWTRFKTVELSTSKYLYLLNKVGDQEVRRG